ACQSIRLAQVPVPQGADDRDHDFLDEVARHLTIARALEHDRGHLAGEGSNELVLGIRVMIANALRECVARLSCRSRARRVRSRMMGNNGHQGPSPAAERGLILQPSRPVTFGCARATYSAETSHSSAQLDRFCFAVLREVFMGIRVVIVTVCVSSVVAAS